jgi:hypothetical protein
VHNLAIPRSCVYDCAAKIVFWKLVCEVDLGEHFVEFTRPEDMNHCCSASSLLFRLAGRTRTAVKHLQQALFLDRLQGSLQKNRIPLPAGRPFVRVRAGFTGSRKR